MDRTSGSPGPQISGGPPISALRAEEVIRNANPAADIVLVHGGFADGSGWRALCDLLARDGYHVAGV